jgi:glycyl-tRNA synthetase beta subunit
VWWRIGFLSFGGPAGQIALMHRIIIDEKRWLDESRFLHALNYCMLLPGPEAQQLASANKRISNILKKNPIDSNSQVKTALLQIPAENERHSALIQIQASLTKAYLDKRFLDVLQALVSLSKPIDHFFADVMVMDQNIELRNNRLALLKDLHRQMNLVADISALAPQS